MGTAENEPLRLLISYLTTSHYRHGEHVMPLEKLLKAKLEKMVDEIAEEVIAEAPGIRGQIKDHARATLSKAMREDNWLRRTVVQAVAKSIGSHALDDDDD